ncbi:MAG: UvrB/UvrC motif-containing protein, partial [Ignavibacteriales bacterium]|nr:UvrB/UvrC motif-containing protein [Ignavibacteriales bacterium]
DEGEQGAASAESAGKEPTPKPKLTKLEQLEHQLKEAIAREDYEQAAKLRDEIHKLQGRNS